VWQLTPAGVLAQVAGAYTAIDRYTGDGQPALQTGLIDPVEVSLDAAGDLYISELQRVRCVPAATGIVDTVAGNGTFGFSGDGGSALMAALNTPAGLALNNGSLYISDMNNQRVRQVTADGTIYTVATGLAGPTGLAFDPAGNLYIADTGDSCVLQVSPSGAIATFAGICGASTGYGWEGEPATQTPLNQPQGVVADLAGNVYIADTLNNRVIQVDLQGNIHTVAGNGTAGDAGAGNTSWGELYNPKGLALDSAGNLYIADTVNHRIRMLAPGGAISTIAGTGTSGFSGDGGAALAATLNAPSAVSVDPGGNIYIADTDNQRVRLVTADGNISTIAGTGDAAYNGDNGPAVRMALHKPGALALDGQGNVSVADSYNNRARMLSTARTVVVTPPPPQLITVTLANAASLLPGPLAPGEIFSIFGQGIGPTAAVTGAFDALGTLSTTLADVQVLFTGIPIDAMPAPLYYVQANQINAQVPYAMAGQTSAQLQVVYQGVTLASMQVPLADANPALFTLNYGTGNVVAVNQDGSINSDRNPAPRGSIVVLYATGEGQTSPAGVTGEPAAAPFPLPVLPVSLTMANIPANILFAGEAPGFVGLMQINAQVPNGFVPTGDLPVVLAVGPYQSPAGVTIAVECHQEQKPKVVEGGIYPARGFSPARRGIDSLAGGFLGLLVPDVPISYAKSGAGSPAQAGGLPHGNDVVQSDNAFPHRLTLYADRHRVGPGRGHQTGRDLRPEDLLSGGRLRPGRDSLARPGSGPQRLGGYRTGAGRQVPRLRAGPGWFRAVRQAGDRLSRRHAGGLSGCLLQEGGHRQGHAGGQLDGRLGGHGLCAGASGQSEPPGAGG
jgi:uncharacterized protein (TIGR03437 family)